jgi:hypothetical protein
MVKEEFCGACLALPLAFAGAGAATAGATQSDQHKKRKKILLWTGVGMLGIALLVGFIMAFNKKGCRTCR